MVHMMGSGTTETATATEIEASGGLKKEKVVVVKAEVDDSPAPVVEKEWIGPITKRSRVSSAPQVCTASFSVLERDEIRNF